MGEGGRADGAQPGPAPRLQRGTVSGGCGVADLQDVDLEPGQYPLLDGLPERVDERGLAEDRFVVHGRHQRLVAVAVGLVDAGCGGHVEAAVGGDAGVVVDDRPRLAGQACGAVGLVHDGEAEAVQLLPERPGQRPLQHPGDRPLLGGLLALVLLVLLRVAGGAAGVADEGGVGGEHRHGAGAGPQGQPQRVRRAAHVQVVSQVRAHLGVAVQGADGDRRAGHAVLAPLGHRLRQQVQGGCQHQHPPARFQAAGRLVGDEGLARAGGGDLLGAQARRAGMPPGGVSSAKTAASTASRCLRRSSAGAVVAASVVCLRSLVVIRSVVRRRSRPGWRTCTSGCCWSSRTAAPVWGWDAGGAGGALSVRCHGRVSRLRPPGADEAPWALSGLIAAFAAS
ncbi:hypothetical protein SUDANB19_00002 [Streptomyces sp. enrichment culture]